MRPTLLESRPSAIGELDVIEEKEVTIRMAWN
jgi:hypothetical protein